MVRDFLLWQNHVPSVKHDLCWFNVVLLMCRK